jgi:hypothetical protein
MPRACRLALALTLSAAAGCSNTIACGPDRMDPPDYKARYIEALAQADAAQQECRRLQTELEATRNELAAERESRAR